MCPKSVVTSCDTKTSRKVIGNSPDGSLQLEGSPVCGNQAIDRKSDNQGDVQPVDVLVPVGLGDGFFGDVWLLGVVLLVAVWF